MMPRYLVYAALVVAAPVCLALGAVSAVSTIGRRVFDGDPVSLDDDLD